MTLPSFRSRGQSDLRGALKTAAEEAVGALEQHIYMGAAMQLRASPKGDAPKGDAPKVDALYRAELARALELAQAQVGPFPEDTLGQRYAAGGLSAAELLASRPAALDPREAVRRQFVRALMAADARYGDKQLALDTAAAIESACYNATVRISKGESDPPRRQWEEPLFVDIYSTRCGSVYGLLDPESTPSRLYDPQVVQRLLSGALTPAEIGQLEERELCPRALAAERAEIAARSAQRVVAKESAIFACPHCKERRCTYTEVQRRSLDEPPDYICVCLNERCRRQFTGRQ